jgi:fibronectin type III domain protein
VGTALSVNLSGLAQLTNYTVQVESVNVTGAGPASSAAFTTLPSLPGAPGVPSFSNITPTTATVVWPASSGTVTSYQYSLNSGGWINVGTALTVNLSGLAPGSNNTVRVEAVNVTGPSTASSNGFTTPPALPGSPGAPSFSSITGTTSTASWGAASGTVASYQYSVNSGAWTNVGTALSANLSGLTAGTSYTVQVEAVNITGASTASSAAFTTLAPPSSPGTPSFSAIAVNSATVSWGAASGTVASYQYSVNSGAWVNVGTALSANLSGLAAATSYTVQVEAVNTSFTGGASSASFTTLPITETATVTPELVKEADNLTMVGYYQGVGGSISPVKLSNNVLSYIAFCDQHATPGSSHIQISGFTSDPGASWLISAEANGVTNLGSAASGYAYAGGTASWAWATSFQFVATGTVAVQVVHH